MKYAKSIRAIFAVALLINVGLSANAKAELSEDEAKYLWTQWQASIIAQEKLSSLSKQYRPKSTLITNVKIIDTASGSIRNETSVMVCDGKVVSLGKLTHAATGSDYETIDGEGKYLFPGLTDMHVHTHDEADYLLHLSYGITTIREMNGWQYRLERRDAAHKADLLAPNMFITSRILNSNDFGGFAVAVNGPEGARHTVRKHAREGYDAIKIHNGLSTEEFHAVVAEAKIHDLKVVGHIPVQVSVSEAIAAGLHTAEHFKGYINDNSLQIAEDDWLAASQGSQMYLTPTFYTYREHLRGEQVQKIIEEASHLVPPHRRLLWNSRVDDELDGLTKLRQTIRPKSEKIFKELLPLNLKWLAGTDSGGYELMVPGEALIEELEIMEGLGLSTLKTLQASTTTAASAMDWDDKIGQIAPGYNADFLLLDSNPMETVKNLRSLKGVMIRGVWISDAASLRLTDIDYRDIKKEISPERLKNAVARTEALVDSGSNQFPMALEGWIRLVDSQGHQDLVERLQQLED